MKQHIRPLVSMMLAAILAGFGLLAVNSRSQPVPIVYAASPPQPVPSLAVVQADPGVQQIARANADFGFRLLAQLAPAKPTGNVFFSPFSISQALALTLNGAGGQTRQSIAATLGLGAMPTEGVNQANGLLLPSLENPDPQVQLSVANALWIGQGYAFNPDFQARCKQFYNADTTALNFGSADAAPTINAWVSQHTQGKIPEIVSPSDLTSATAVLTSAVYFHGQWTQQFDKKDTRNKSFIRADGSKKIVPFMAQKDDYSYLETDDFQAVRLPYGQGRLAMYVFLPKSPSGLDGFLKTLTAAQWEKWRAQMQTTELALYLPRFHADDEWTLNKPLSSHGYGVCIQQGCRLFADGFTAQLHQRSAAQSDIGCKRGRRSRDSGNNTPNNNDWRTPSYVGASSLFLRRSRRRDGDDFVSGRNPRPAVRERRARASKKGGGKPRPYTIMLRWP